MADILSTQNVEPGFYSQVRENVNLQLPPNTLNIVAVIGAGKATTTMAETVVPGMTGVALDTRILPYDVLSAGVASFSGFDGTLNKLSSAYGFGVLGSVSEPFNCGASGESGGLNVSISNTTYSIDIAGTSMSAGNIVAAINGSTGAGEIGLFVKAFEQDGKVGVASLMGEEMKILPGTINSVIGLLDNSYANLIYWYADAPVSSYSAVYEIMGSKTAPTYLYSEDSVYSTYGDASVANTISLGARAAFKEGAQVVLCRMMDPQAMDLMTEFQAALDELKKYNCSIIVPMLPINTYPEVSAKVLSHVSEMSNKVNRKERIGILGVDETVSIMPVNGTNSWASIMATFKNLNPATGMKSNRIIVMSPGSSFTSLVAGTTEVNGTFLAAALAGRMLNTTYDEAEPMTRKPLITVSGLYKNLSDEKSRVEKNELSGTYGVTVVEMNGVLCVVRRAVTANTSSIASQEISIVRSFDRIAADLRAILEAQYIGTKISGSTGAFIVSSTNKYLQGMVDSSIIGAFRNVRATQNTSDPRQFDVSFEAVPIYPFLWGFIDISITLA